jgi:hypothetical protein
MASFRIVILMILVALTAGCKEDPEILLEDRSWPTETISQLGGIKAHLKTSWRDGQLYYLYSVSPASEDAEDIKEFDEAVKRSRLEDHYFTVYLYKGGLSIVELKVPFVSMTYDVNFEGKTTKLERNSATLLSAENYQAARTWDVKWSEGLVQLFQKPAKEESIQLAPKSAVETTTPSVTPAWSVQVNAYVRQENARSLIKRLKDKGYDAYVVSTKINGQTWYRVRVGHLATQEEAKPLLQTLQKKEKYTKAFIVKGK